MTVYEKVDEQGQVVERVQPVPGDFTDTLLGLQVLDGDPHWRIAGAPAREPAGADEGQAQHEDPDEPPVGDEQKEA